MQSTFAVTRTDVDDTDPSNSIVETSILVTVMSNMCPNHPVPSLGTEEEVENDAKEFFDRIVEDFRVNNISRIVRSFETMTPYKASSNEHGTFVLAKMTFYLDTSRKIRTVFQMSKYFTLV